MGKSIVVVSAVNFTTGGPFTILKKFLAATNNKENVSFIALVHSAKELKGSYPWVKFIEFPEVKGSWLKRLHFEYVVCKKLSKELNATHWICLHDITANVVTKKRYVYCHNPAPFYKGILFREILMEPSFFLFKMLYGLIYKINIKKNTAVFVQQFWMKEKFIKKYSINNIIVSRPEIKLSDKSQLTDDDSQFKNNPSELTIFYPAVPRVFKNYELIISAARKLKEQSNIKFLLTISGTENAYAKYIISLAEGLDNVHFLGYLDKEKIDHCYNISDIVCFPSRLETWGLPLSEAKERGKWVLASDFPFTRETLGSYEKKAFFDSNNDDMLVKLIIDFKKGNLKKDISDANFIYRNENVLVGFDELVNFITEEH